MKSIIKKIIGGVCLGLIAILPLTSCNKKKSEEVIAREKEAVKDVKHIYSYMSTWAVCEDISQTTVKLNDSETNTTGFAAFYQEDTTETIDLNNFSSEWEFTVSKYNKVSIKTLGTYTKNGKTYSFSFENGSNEIDNLVATEQ